MTAFSQRIVPTLTEVLDAADLQFPGNGNGNGNGTASASDAAAEVDASRALFGVAAEPVLIDAALRQSITDAVDAAVADLRARLLPQVEALIQQALVERAKRTSD